MKCGVFDTINDLLDAEGFDNYNCGEEQNIDDDFDNERGNNGAGK
jgi:hypothetical protein